MAKIVTNIPSTANGLHNDLRGLNEGDYQHLTQVEKFNLEYITNKQDSLDVDTTNIKYPTVNAVRSGDIETLINANAYTDTKVSSVYKYKGSVTSYINLPTTGNIIGDVWNVLDTDINYAWTGTEWDSLGGIVDISGKEDKINKQNSLTTDGTGTKYPTVDAVNANNALKLDKGTYTGNAQDLKTDIDNIYQPNVLLQYTVPTRSVNTFTFPSLGYLALINKVEYQNTTSFITTILAATTDYKRTDLVYITTGGIIGIKTGVESITVAERPALAENEVAVAFINVFGNVISDPTPVSTEISIQDTLGFERFLISDYIRFENVSFNASQKKITIDPIVANYVYVNTVTGNDATAASGNFNKPFKTHLAAYNAIPVKDGSWTMHFTDGNVVRDMLAPISGYVLYSTGSGTFDLTNNTIAVQPNNYCKIYLPNAELKVAGSNKAIGVLGQRLDIELGKLTLNVRATAADNPLFPSINMSENSTFVNSTVKIGILENNIANTLCRGYSNIEIKKMILTQRMYYSGSSNQQIYSTYSVDEISISSGSYSLFTGGNSPKMFTLKTITGTGTINVGTLNQASTIYHDNLVLASGIIYYAAGSTGDHYISGTVTSTLNNFLFQPGNGPNNIKFRNFKGKITAPTNCSGSGSLLIENSDITVDNHLIQCWPTPNAAAGFQSIKISGLTTITSLNGFDQMIINQAVNINCTISGVFKTNFTTLGKFINSSYIDSTFKEKNKEIVIRNKIDLVGRTLSSQMTYIIDGTITLLTGEYIEVPAGGLTLVGYGFDVSKISKNVSGQSIFISPSGNSGNLVLKDMTFEPGVGSVFNIIDSNGSHAIELNDVNFQGVTGSSLGTLTGYRQFTGTTCGFYGLSDGFTIDGNWSGWKLTNSNVIGFSASGTLFKKGTSLIFSNRFYIDLNLQIATGSKICDFQESNFTNNKSLQIVNCYTKVNGVIDPSTTTITFPNISPFSVKSYFLNNQGITNSRYTIENGVENNEAVAVGQLSDTIVSSASSLSLSNTSRVMYYTYTGSTPATWTIPPIVGNSKLRLVLYNTGTGTVTINTNTGGNDIYDSGTMVNTGTVNPGTRVELFNNSVTYIMS